MSTEPSELSPIAMHRATHGPAMSYPKPPSEAPSVLVPSQTTNAINETNDCSIDLKVPRMGDLAPVPATAATSSTVFSVCPDDQHIARKVHTHSAATTPMQSFHQCLLLYAAGYLLLTSHQRCSAEAVRTYSPLLCPGIAKRMYALLDLVLHSIVCMPYSGPPRRQLLYLFRPSMCLNRLPYCLLSPSYPRHCIQTHRH